MDRPILLGGAVAAALSVMAGAFGAHALAERLEPRQLELWEIASRYLMYASLGAAVMAMARRWCSVRAAGSALLVGGAIFAGTLYAMALGGPSWLGAITPLGGAGMILGWVLFAWGVARMREGS